MESDADSLTPCVTLETPEPENPELVRAATRAIEIIRSTQKPDGCWDAPIEGDASVTAHHVLLMHCLRRVDPVLQEEMVRFIRAEQNPEGGWSTYPGGPSALDETVICYAALKAFGISADDPALVRARSVIGRLGGLGRTGLSARAVLVFLGQIPLKVIPYVSPKVVNLPKWFHPNIYDLSLVRLIVVPVALLRKLKPLRPLPPERGIGELIMGQIHWDIRPKTLDEANEPITSLEPWRQGASGVVGRFADWLSKGTKALRKESAWKVLKVITAISQIIDRLFPGQRSDLKAMEWIIGRQEKDGTIAGVFFATMAGLVALDNAPGGIYSHLVDRGLAGLNGWLVRDPRGTHQQYIQMAGLPTAYALQALLESGIPKDDPPVLAAVQWLVNHQAKVAGDWQRRVKGYVEPGGWSVGVAAEQYPDVDCTVTVLQALLPVRHLCKASFQKAVNWVLALEDQDGGWAAWDKNNRRGLFFSLEVVMPGTADLPDEDITARVLCVLGPLMGTSYDRGGRITAAVKRGVDFLWRMKKPEGTWYGHWVVNYAYGTAQVLQAFARARVNLQDPRIRKAVGWLKSIQNPDGGWGESKESYKTGHFEPGPSDSFITAFVLAGLSAADRPYSQAVVRGLSYLIKVQEGDGSWQDRLWSGVTIPGMSYCKYNLVPTCSAVIAIFRKWGSYEKVYQPADGPHRS